MRGPVRGQSVQERQGFVRGVSSVDSPAGEYIGSRDETGAPISAQEKDLHAGVCVAQENDCGGGSGLDRLVGRILVSDAVTSARRA